MSTKPKLSNRKREEFIDRQHNSESEHTEDYRQTVIDSLSASGAQITHLRDCVTQMAESTVRLEKSTERLVTAVLGDSEAGSTGLVRRMEHVENRQDAIDKKLFVGYGIVATVSATFSGIATWWGGHSK